MKTVSKMKKVHDNVGFFPFFRFIQFLYRRRRIGKPTSIRFPALITLSITVLLTAFLVCVSIRIGYTSAKYSVLIIYNYFEKDDSYKTNFKYFLANGFHPSKNVHYIFVVNGDVHVDLPGDNSFITVIRKQNRCFDFGSYGVALKLLKSKLKSYKYFVFLNSSVRGPFLPSFVKNSYKWYEAFIKPLNGEIKLSGLAVNCPDGVGRRIPHVMSMMFALDKIGLRIAQKNNVFDCSPSKTESLYAEGDLSKSILENGYNFAVMQMKYSKIDFRDVYKEPQPCAVISRDIFLDERAEDGIPTNPLETIFFKTNRGVTPKVLELYTTWNMPEPSGEDEKNIPSPLFRFPIVNGASTIDPTLISIGVYSHNMNLEGAPRMILNLFRGLSKLTAYRADIYSAHEGDLQNQWKDVGANLYLGENAINQLAQKAAEYDTLIFNTLISFPLLDVIDEELFSKIVWIIHESELKKYFLEFPNLEEKIEAYMRKVAKVIFVCHWTRLIYSPYDFGNFHTIYNGINLDERNEILDIYTKREARNELELPEHGVIILSVGTITDRKGQITLLKAIQNLKSIPKFESSVYVYAIGRSGEDEQYENLLMKEKEESRLTNFRIIDKTDKVPLYLRAADILVSSSSVESFPLNTLEGMAYGLTTVSTPVFGAYEQIENNETGIFTPVGDYEELSKVIRRLFEDTSLREHLGSNGRTFVEKHFNSKKQELDFHEIIKEIISKKALPLPEFGKSCIVLPFIQENIDSQNRLLQTLRSLQGQIHDLWDVIIPAIGIDYKHLVDIQKHMKDNRIRIIRIESDAPGFIDKNTSELLLKGAEHCPMGTEWIFATNLHFEFAPKFLNFADPDYDLITCQNHVEKCSKNALGMSKNSFRFNLGTEHQNTISSKNYPIWLMKMSKWNLMSNTQKECFISKFHKFNVSNGGFCGGILGNAANIHYQTCKICHL